MTKDQQMLRRRSRSDMEGASCSSFSPILPGEIRREIMNVPKEDQHWRRFGMELREKLLVRDASSGGTLFKINGQCHISQYLQVSERAMDQFYALLAKATDMEQTYVMGYRIASFLTIALPQHPDYPTNIGCSRMREIRKQLERLRHCLEELAMMIDESQLDKFFSEDFDPVIHNGELDDKSSSDEESESEHPQTSENLKLAPAEGVRSPPPYEQFAIQDKPEEPDSTTITTEVTNGTGSLTSSTLEQYDISSDESERESIHIDFGSKQSNTNVDGPSPPPCQGAPTLPHRLTEEQVQTQTHCTSLVTIDTTFLEYLMNEEVDFEDDSEAADSWLQDEGGSECSFSASSGGERITYDPAKLVFRQMRKYHSKHNPALDHRSQSLSPSAIEEGASPEEEPGRIVPNRRFVFADDGQQASPLKFEETQSKDFYQNPVFEQGWVQFGSQEEYPDDEVDDDGAWNEETASF